MNKKIYSNEAKEALYTLNKSQKYIKCLIVIVCVFVAFFTSKIYLPPKASQSEVAINKKIEFSDNRNVTVLSAIYDKEAKKIELMLVYQNGAADGIDDYFYVLGGMGTPGFSLKKLSCTEVLNDPLCSVLVIDNAKSFKEIDLYLAPKLSENLSNIKDSDTAVLVFNKNNLKNGKIIPKSRTEYLNDRIELSIASLERKIAYHEERIERYKNKIADIKAANINLNDSLNMLAGAEYDEAVANIATNKSKIAEYKEATIRCEIYIEDYQKQIKQLNKSKQSL